MIAFDDLLEEKRRQNEEARRRQASDAKNKVAAEKTAPVATDKAHTHLSQNELILRAKRIKEMFARGKQNSEVMRVCKEEFGKSMNCHVLNSMRDGTFRGVGWREFSEKQEAPQNLPPVKGESDLQTLRREFARCLSMMRQQGIVLARLDAQTNEAQIDIKASQTLRFSD